MHGLELVGVNGGAVVRFTGAGGEGGLDLGAGRSAVSPSSPAAAQKGNGVGRRIWFDSACVEL